jgi:CRISPR-associated protein Cas1
MLSLPDFKEKKIIMLGSYGGEANELKFRNSNIRLYKNGEFVNQISCHIVFCVFIIGECTLTSVLIKQLKQHGISIFLLNTSLQCYAEVVSLAEGNYVLRDRQYKLNDTETLEFSKILVRNKINNQYRMLQLTKRKPSKKQLQLTLKTIASADNQSSLLGIEGNYSKYYFEKAFSDYGWYRRAPRTKEDINNLLLDMGYTFLFNYVDSLLRLFGFDTYKGIYHQLFFQRKSLSCDIEEPFRPLIDRQLVKSHNLGQIDEKDFKFYKGAYKIKDYKLQKKYTYIWFNLIMEHKEDIYNYVLGFYRHFLNPIKYPEPEYKLC